MAFSEQSPLFHHRVQRQEAIGRPGLHNVDALRGVGVQLVAVALREQDDDHAFFVVGFVKPPHQGVAVRQADAPWLDFAAAPAGLNKVVHGHDAVLGVGSGVGAGAGHLHIPVLASALLQLEKVVGLQHIEQSGVAVLFGCE